MIRAMTTPADDRLCFAAIVYLGRTSTPWRLLPARELGCGSPATSWRRLTEWANVGVFDQLHLKVPDRAGVAGRLDWARAVWTRSLTAVVTAANVNDTTLFQAVLDDVPPVRTPSWRWRCQPGPATAVQTTRATGRREVRWAGTMR
jgi:transposase